MFGQIRFQTFEKSNNENLLPKIWFVHQIIGNLIKPMTEGSMGHMM